MRTFAMISGLIMALLSGSPLATGKGWFEIIPAESRLEGTESFNTNVASGVQGDKLYITQPGDTLPRIAKTITGNAANSSVIGAYNRILLNAPVGAGKLLLIPGSLLSSSVDSIPQSNNAIKEVSILEPALQPAGESLENRSVSLVHNSIQVADNLPLFERALKTENIDMFVGEVRVLGEVLVNRVAVGNGKMIRAEVLATGELLVIAQAAGSSSLRLWHSDASQSDFNIRVSADDPETRFHLEKMVRMKVRMVEFRKSALGQLGINWSDSAAGPTIATAGDVIGNALYRPLSEGFDASLPKIVKPFSTYFGIASNVTSRINFLSSTGDATTLAEPVLSCVNGGSAQFLAGGEVPYPSIGANGQSTVQFKEYGIKLKVSPKVDSFGNVQALIDTEISQLDPAVTVQGAPGLLTRRAQTQVNVRSGQTIVISGLLSAENGEDTDGLPGIGRIPVIGSLFRSRNHRDSVTELVIFVTPEVIDPAENFPTDNEQQILATSTRVLERQRQTLPILD